MSRIINGYHVAKHQFPWMAAMYSHNKFLCAGAVISDKNILTAGNFLKEFFPRKVEQNFSKRI
jgi:hypothetical protein